MLEMTISGYDISYISLFWGKWNVIVDVYFAEIQMLFMKRFVPTQTNYDEERNYLLFLAVCVRFMLLNMMVNFLSHA